METVVKVVGAIVLVVVIVFVLALIMAFPVMWLMNYLFAPSFLTMVFGISQMTLWKAFWFNFFMGLAIRSSCSHSSKD